MAGLRDFESALAASEKWVEDLRSRLGWEHAEYADLALRGTLHALRDDLPTDEAIRLGSALPALLRGFYYEGWHPRHRPIGQKSRETFFSRVHDGVHRDPGIDPERVSHAVFALLAERLPSADLEEIKAATPASLHGLWPD